MMKQLSLFTLGLITMFLVGCQPTKNIVIPAGWQSYKITQDTAIASFALPPDFKEVNYFFYESSELHPGQKSFYGYDRGFKSKDFELSAVLNSHPQSGLSYIIAVNTPRREDALYKKKKIAGRTFWVRGLWTTSAESMRYIMLYYLDYLDAGGNHLHIDIYCYRTKRNMRKAKRLIKSIAKTMEIQVTEKKKQ